MERYLLTLGYQEAKIYIIKVSVFWMVSFMPEKFNWQNRVNEKCLLRQIIDYVS